MYCRNCGKELSSQAELCMACGVRPPRGDKFCQNCGAGVASAAEICIKCGTSLSKTKKRSKAASVLLAVFLSYWTWLYTYKKDTWKFWLSFALIVANIILIIVTFGIWLIVAWLIIGGIWIWAIVDTAVKNDEWYENY